jgi:hypothetical protein
MTETLLTPTEAEASDNHAYKQAQAQARHIAAQVAAMKCDYDRLQELRDEREELSDAVEEAEENETEGKEEQCIAFEARASLANWDEENATELNELEHEAGEFESEEQARERIQEDALSVEVRSGWESPSTPMEACEFRIVLCTGGPHVEIRGEIGAYGEPTRAWLNYQDWGTPLTQYFDIDQDTLIEYCRQFYFGE